MRRLVSASCTLAAVFALSACGAGAVEESEVESKISEQLTQQVGQAPDDIDCPGDLNAEVGTKMTCELTAGEDVLDVAVEVTEVKDGNAQFDIEVLGPAE